MRRIMLVADNADLAFGHRNAIEVEGYLVHHVDSGPGGAPEEMKPRPDLPVLDLMLEGFGGDEVLRRLRSARIGAPVLILTARGEEVDKVQGFRLGADDYVVKPVVVLEFLARVEALLRRTSSDVGATFYRFGELWIDGARRAAGLGDEEVALSPLEFDLLLALARRRGGFVTRAVLLREVWGYHSDVESRTVDTHIAKLRANIDREAPSHITTIRKRGYRLH